MVSPVRKRKAKHLIGNTPGVGAPSQVGNVAPPPGAHHTGRTLETHRHLALVSRLSPGSRPSGEGAGRSAGRRRLNRARPPRRLTGRLLLRARPQPTEMTKIAMIAATVATPRCLAGSAASRAPAQSVATTCQGRGGSVGSVWRIIGYPSVQGPVVRQVYRFLTAGRTLESGCEAPISPGFVSLYDSLFGGLAASPAAADQAALRVPPLMISHARYPAAATSYVKQNAGHQRGTPGLEMKEPCTRSKAPCSASAAATTQRDVRNPTTASAMNPTPTVDSDRTARIDPPKPQTGSTRRQSRSRQSDRTPGPDPA